MTLKVGALGYDYAFQHPSLSAIVADGARYLFRYSAGAASAPSHQSHGLNAGKLITPAEFKAILDAGLDPVANDEWYETRVTEGERAGFEDGQAAGDLWHSCGLAKGASIYCSWDASPNTALYNAVQDYYGGFNRGLAGEYVADGCYAGLPAIVEFSRRGFIKHGWVPEAPGWSVPNEQLPPNYAPPAHTAWDLWNPTPSQVSPAIEYLRGKLSAASLVSAVWQDRNKRYGNAADENLILVSGPLGSHKDAQSGPNTTNPPLKGDDMFLAHNDDAQAADVLVGAGPVPLVVTSARVRGALVRYGVPVQGGSAADYQTLRTWADTGTQPQ